MFINIMALLESVHAQNHELRAIALNFDVNLADSLDLAHHRLVSSGCVVRSTPRCISPRLTEIGYDCLRINISVLEQHDVPGLTQLDDFSWAPLTKSHPTFLEHRVKCVSLISIMLLSY